MRHSARGLFASLGFIGLLILVGAGVAIGLGGWPNLGSSAIASAPAGDDASARPSGPSENTTADPVDRIRIERLGIDLPIAEGDGIDAPLDSAAHYPGSGWPGDGTNIYLYAHARPGLFDRLKEAQVGDRVVLTMADGSGHAYEVATIIPAAPWNAMEYVEETPTEQLTLQTSTSEVPKDPRFIVIAYPAS